ncbi:MAG: carboxypeptidase regulatory-like domain-containing protein [Planctomycetes bacterium]|nr:carboxypeptidase regulatory-like domain-containing protein [Planctomycetota bacterium]
MIESSHPLIAAIADPSLTAPSARLRRVHALLRDDWTLAVRPDEHGLLPIDIAIEASTWRVVAALLRRQATLPASTTAFRVLAGCVEEWSLERAGHPWSTDVEHALWVYTCGRLLGATCAEPFAHLDHDAIGDLAFVAIDADAWPTRDAHGAVEAVPLDAWRVRHAEWRARVIPDTSMLRGRVVDLHGAAVADALVHWNLESMRTGADGRFTFAVDRATFYAQWTNVEEDALHALARDGRFAIVRDLRPRASSEPEVRIVLDSTLTTIQGKVVDAAGAPVADADVAIESGTFFAWVASYHLTGWQALRWEDAAYGCSVVRTGADGTFWFGAFAGRAYDLHAVTSRPMRHAVVRATPAGAVDVVVRFASADTNGRTVRGVIRTRDGLPVEGVDVSARIEVRLLPNQSCSVNPLSAIGGSVRTDAEGRFELQDVADGAVEIVARSDDIECSRYTFDPVPDTIELVVELLCPLRLLVTNPSSIPCWVQPSKSSFARKTSRGTRTGGSGRLRLDSTEPSDTLWLPESVDALLVESESDPEDAPPRRIPIRLNPDARLDVEV